LLCADTDLLYRDKLKEKDKEVAQKTSEFTQKLAQLDGVKSQLEAQIINLNNAKDVIQSTLDQERKTHR
jgi:hypothetical protein